MLVLVFPISLSCQVHISPLHLDNTRFNSKEQWREGGHLAPTNLVEATPSCSSFLDRKERKSIQTNTSHKGGLSGRKRHLGNQGQAVWSGTKVASKSSETMPSPLLSGLFINDRPRTWVIRVFTSCLTRNNKDRLLRKNRTRSHDFLPRHNGLIS